MPDELSSLRELRESIDEAARYRDAWLSARQRAKVATANLYVCENDYERVLRQDIKRFQRVRRLEAGIEKVLGFIAEHHHDVIPVGTVERDLRTLLDGPRS